jgi:hypothetical protein
LDVQARQLKHRAKRRAKRDYFCLTGLSGAPAGGYSRRCESKQIDEWIR